MHIVPFPRARHGKFVDKTMAKPTINAKAVLRDIKNGASKAELMEKYKLSPKGLESLYQKLVAAGILPAGELTRRSVQTADLEQERPSRPPRPAAEKRSSQGPAGPAKGAAEPQAKPKSAALKVSEQAKDIADDINAGMTDIEIMRRHEISPGQLRQIKERLVQVGLLKPPESGGGSASAKASRTCPSCGHEVPSTAAKCNHCGEWLDDRAMSAPIGPPRVGESAVPRLPQRDARPFTDDTDIQDDEECPWEERENYGTFNAFLQTATRILLTPTQFFSKLPISGGFLNPILFAIFSTVVSVALGYAITQLFMGGGGGLFLFIIVIVGSMLGLAIGVPISLFLGSATLHGCLLLVGGAQRGFEATFRVVSYSSVTGLFSVIPIVGVFANLWGLVLTVIGLRETHRISTGKAAAAVAIPVGVVVVLALVLIITGVLALSSAFKEAAVQTELSGQKLPAEVCTAIQEFLAEVDFAKDVEDAKSAQEQMQQALKSLNETLKVHSGHPDIQEVQKLATVYGMAAVAQKQLKSVTGGVMPGLEGVEAHRERLNSLCP